MTSSFFNNKLMKKTLAAFIFFFVSCASNFSFAEIVTLDDGRIVDLKDDGTFTVISEKEGEGSSNYQNSIIFLLDLLSINYQSIDFSYIDDSKIVLKNVTIEELEIGQLTFIKLNKQYFENFNFRKFDSYKGNLFEKLIINNLSAEIDSGSHLSISLLEINNLDIKKIDLLKKLIEGSVLSNPQNILSVIDSLSIDKFVIKNFKTRTIPDIYAGLDSFVINNLKNSSIGDLFYTGLHFNNDDQLIKIDKFEINDLIFNRPSTYMKVFTKLNHPRDLFLFFNSLKRISTIGYYQELKSDGFIIKIDESEITNIKTKKIEGLSIPVLYEVRTKGMQIIITDLLIENELKKLDYDKFKFDTEFILSWNIIFNIISFDLIIGMQDGFDLSLKTKFEDVDLMKIINLLLSPELLNSLKEDPKFKKLEISLRDKGLTSRLIDYGATNLNKTRSEFIDYIIDEMQSNTMIDNSLMNDFIISLTNFIQQPEKIVFSANPSTSLSYADIYYLIESPDLLVNLLNLKIK